MGNLAPKGESILHLTPRNAGESPVIYYSIKLPVTENDAQVDDLENFSTGEGTLYFLVKDSAGTYESGPATRWVAELKIRHQIEPAADKRNVTLQCTPAAEMFYTLEGSNPKDGAAYKAPFEVGPDATKLLVYAKAGEATKTADFQIPRSGDKQVQIDDTKPARLHGGKRVSLDTTDRVFGVINRFKDQANTRFKGVQIEIGEGENTVTVRFREREITAAMIEGTVTSLREIIEDIHALIAITVTDGIQFDNGFEAKEFATIAGIELKPGDIVQEE